MPLPFTLIFKMNIIVFALRHGKKQLISQQKCSMGLNRYITKDMGREEIAIKRKTTQYVPNDFKYLKLLEPLKLSKLLAIATDAYFGLLYSCLKWNYHQVCNIKMYTNVQKRKPQKCTLTLFNNNNSQYSIFHNILLKTTITQMHKQIYNFEYFACVVIKITSTISTTPHFCQFG